MAESEATPAAEEEKPEVPNLVDTLVDGTLVRLRQPRQRACNMPKGKKICAGHLKRWCELTDEIRAKFGAEAEIYRCERCRTLYLPNPQEIPRTGTLAY